MIYPVHQINAKRECCSLLPILIMRILMLLLIWIYMMLVNVSNFKELIRKEETPKLSGNPSSNAQMATKGSACKSLGKLQEVVQLCPNSMKLPGDLKGEDRRLSLNAAPPGDSAIRRRRNLSLKMAKSQSSIPQAPTKKRTKSSS